MLQGTLFRVSMGKVKNISARAGDVEVNSPATATAPVTATPVTAEAPAGVPATAATANSTTTSGNYTQHAGFGYIATDMVRSRGQGPTCPLISAILSLYMFSHNTYMHVPY